MTTYLISQEGTRSGFRYPLTNSGENLLGRDWQCRVVLDDPQCSRVHAVVYFADGAWWVEDRGSSNGTYVNGQRVDQARLIHNHQLRLGSSSFTFVDLPHDELNPSKATKIENEAKTQTLVSDELFDPADTGHYTLAFLKNHNWGEDFFFLFQLSVKLLNIDTADEVARVCVNRLFDRTQATVAGLMWLTDKGQLTPRIVLPQENSNDLVLSSALTKRVVHLKHALRIEHSTSQHGKGYADSICVPIIVGDDVAGALHLYRRNEPFRDAHFQLANSVANIMARALTRAQREASLIADNVRLANESADFNELLGNSPPMQTLRDKIVRVAKATGCVLIRGESGSGKELVARALHRASPRCNRPMLSVNCAAIPRDLMESQLFGHKRGAFTSADSDHVGWFQQADTGTLFLDEIGELTLEGQAKLLRILEGHPFLPVGGTSEVQVDVRVICATNRDLREFVAEKKFREDLYYRLSVFELQLAPLRERGEDIGLLIDHFVEHYRHQHGRLNIRLSTAAREKLLTYEWPGNVRQLRNVIDCAIVLADREEIQVDDLGFRDASSGELETLRLDYWERKLIKEALKRSGNNVPSAANLLGLSRATLYRKIEEYGIKR
ncbi:MAG TPA: sigma 54-interacting transcriptional regulator [Pirellulaceae bacterium]|nr:sigma 54-interacting transcriptional regulator [Pirellulaceae bacterium]HMP70082.1 sigma 54-interacting transcriptional regulator [Pirellulaceae bacterium]